MTSRSAFALVALLFAATPATAQTRWFSAGSIVIPMDTVQQTSPGGIFGAVGLVYRLLQRGVPVFAIISPTKASLVAADFTITTAAGTPAGAYTWATGAFSNVG